MKISIIVPVFNVENYIKRCLESIANQTYENFEVIIIDDGSTDSSGQICKCFTIKDKRFKVFCTENGGAAKARNYALTLASGEYLFYVDGDDYIDDDTLEKMVSISDGKDIVYCDYCDAYDSGEIVNKKLIPFDLFNERVHIMAMPGPVCKLIKRELFLSSNLQFLEGKCFEDNAIMPVLSSLAKEVAYLQETKYYYFKRSNSALNQKKYNEKWEDIFEVLDYMKQQFEERGLFERFHEEIEYIFIEYLLHAANLRFFDYPEGRYNIKKVSDVMKHNFPNWQNNLYFKKESWKYRFMCKLFYYNKVFLIKLIRRSR